MYKRQPHKRTDLLFLYLRPIRGIVPAVQRPSVHGILTLSCGCLLYTSHIPRLEVFDGTRLGVVFADGLHADRGQDFGLHAVVLQGY